ncbi:MAG: hypothetical protein CM1200mP41_17910 [Gammaproteobacteria bacterium]|nr:MAG: hypothetical protein CM1200mP41_17910 [Gammaproteobacteria bacterium]
MISGLYSDGRRTGANAERSSGNKTGFERYWLSLADTDMLYY